MHREARAEPWDKPGYTLTFHDEFDGSELYTSAWERRFKSGEAVLNNEVQAYTDDQFAVADGFLSIVGEKKPASYADMNFDYASGLIASVHRQKYGWFEMRAKFPAGKGLWPAFRLLGENGTTGVHEIDIVEFLGDDPTKVDMTVHWGESYTTGHEFERAHYVGPDFSADFHTYAVDWTPTSVRFYVDGVERLVHTGAGVPDVDMYLIANLAIGVDRSGPPSDATTFPANYTIDYIRAYQVDETNGAGGSDGLSGNGGSGGDGDTAFGGTFPGSALGCDVVSECDDGCGCRAVRATSGNTTPWFALLAGLALYRRRRRT